MPLVKGRKPVTITLLANALNNALTPSTDAISNAFATFATTAADLWRILKLVIGTVSLILTVFNKLTNLLGGTNFATKLLGHSIAVLIILFTLGKIRAMAYGASLVIVDGYEAAATISVWLLESAITVLNATWLASVWTMGIFGGALTFVEFQMLTLRNFILTKMIPAIWEMTISLLSNPLFWIPVLIGIISSPDCFFST